MRVSNRSVSSATPARKNPSRDCRSVTSITQKKNTKITSPNKRKSLSTKKIPTRNNINNNDGHTTPNGNKRSASSSNDTAKTKKAKNTTNDIEKKVFQASIGTFNDEEVADAVEDEEVADIDDDDDSVDIDFKGEVEIPDLDDNGYHWEGLVRPNALSRYKTEDKDKWCLVEPNHIPKEREIDISDAKRRCVFLGIEPTTENLNTQLDDLNTHRRLYKKVGKCFCQQYFVDVGNMLGIKYGVNQQPLSEWDHVVQAFTEADSRAKMKKFAILLYVSFEFIPNYKKQMTDAIMRHCGLKVQKKGKKDRGLNCFHHLSSLCINILRNSLNEMGQKGHGYYTTKVQPKKLKRKDDHLTNDTVRKKRWFYGWMVLGKPVSHYNLFFHIIRLNKTAIYYTLFFHRIRWFIYSLLTTSFLLFHTE